MYRLIYQDGDTPADLHLRLRRGGDRPLPRVPDRPAATSASRGTTPRSWWPTTAACASSTSSRRTAPRSTASRSSRPRCATGTGSSSASSSSPSPRPSRARSSSTTTKPLSEEAGTIIRSVGELSRLLERRRVPKEPADEQKVPAVDVQEIEKSNRILKVLTKVAETLIAVRPVEEVLQQVMDIVFEHMPADRGFLMLAGRERGRAPRADGGEAPQPRRGRGPHHHLQDHRRPRHEGPRRRS